MTEYLVPMGTPQFFHVDTPVTGAGYTWAGAYPYIDTADLGASYGEINTVTTGDSAGQWVGYYIPAFTAPAGVTGARVDLQINMASLDTYLHGPKWNLYCEDMTAPWSGGSLIGAYPTAAVGWNTIADTHTFDVGYGPEYDLPAMLAALATGNMRFFAKQAMIDATFQISQLRLTLTGEGVPICQQLQRRDGLGRGGVPLARGQATRQTSNHARVTY